MKWAAVGGANLAAPAGGTGSAPGEREPIHIDETDTTFAIGWRGRYRIEGATFVYSDQDTGRVTTTILGYPTDKLRQIA